MSKGRGKQTPDEPGKLRFIAPSDMKEFTRHVFMKVGVSRSHAEIVADHLVAANLRGVESHGVARIPFYIEGIKSGEVKTNPKIEVVSEKGATALIDGDYGLGQVVGKTATELAIRKASEFGIGAVGVRRTSHVGMLAYYGMEIASKRMVGLATTNSPAFMAAWGGKKPILGTNPICVAFPGRGVPSVVLDMATSETAAFRINSAASKGEKIPAGWALDEEGNPTTDPQAALRGALLPFGGYKGYGLAVAVELLSSVLLGAEWSSRIKVVFHTEGGLYVQAVDVSHFRPFDEYLGDLEAVLRNIKSSGRGDAEHEVFLPGEKEALNLAERSKRGIPLDEKLMRDLSKVSSDFGVPLGLADA